jgi:hypothetical protein
MPTYEFACDPCDYLWHHTLTIPEYESRPLAVLLHCPLCGGTGHRVYDVAIASVVHEHTSPMYGTASSPRGISDNMKRMSEAASARTGIEHNYQPADPGDHAALGVDPEFIAGTKAVKGAR